VRQKKEGKNESKKERKEGREKQRKKERKRLLSFAIVLFAKAPDKEQHAVVNARKEPALKDPDTTFVAESSSTHDSLPAGIVTP
jgi:hypothetical protein